MELRLRLDPFHQVSISSTFYEQLLHMQIPKVQKGTDDFTFFFAYLGSACVKAAPKTLMKLKVSQ
jgi:hypothetical protein